MEKHLKPAQPDAIVNIANCSIFNVYRSTLYEVVCINLRLPTEHPFLVCGITKQVITSPKVTHVFLAEELRFALFSSNIQCLCKEVRHELILTPLGVMNNRKVTDENDANTLCNSQSKELTTSLREDDNFGERKSRQIFKTLALKTDSNQ